MVSDVLITFTLVNAVVILALLLSSISKIEFTKYEIIRNAQIGFLGISFMQYTLTFIVETSNVLDERFPDFAQKFRYVSWLITTPLILFSYWKLASINGYTEDFILLLFLDLTIFICIILSEAVFKHGIISKILDAISIIAYGFLFWRIIKIMNFFKSKNLDEEARLGYFFLISWPLYLVGVIASENTKYLIYTLSDFINKFLYGRMLNTVIDKK